MNEFKCNFLSYLFTVHPVFNNSIAVKHAMAVGDLTVKITGKQRLKTPIAVSDFYNGKTPD